MLLDSPCQYTQIITVISIYVDIGSQYTFVLAYGHTAAFGGNLIREFLQRQ
jgi:hypothetical protein